ncbi:MAG: PTS system mannose/fructose/sorbose family transporter subunit IID [Elusimicrobia bacterium]|nr:PTS system mannose/fructose/sorbose family transporter subunit IID [Elusimicrobiota bacterium]
MLDACKRRIFWRSFLIQGAWNYERMQNIGFAYSLLPSLKETYGDGPELRRAVGRHLELFNTQPFMAGLVLGMAARAEELMAAAPEQEKAAHEEDIRNTKSAMASAVAAIGDRLFWGLLRPLSLLLTLVLLGPALLKNVFTVSEYSAPAHVSHWNLWLLAAALLAGFMLYNIPAVWLRWRGLSHGYECQGSRSCGIDFLDWHSLIRKARFTGFLLSAALFVLVLSFFTGRFLFRGDPDYGLHSIVVVLFSAVAAFLCKRFGGTSLTGYMVMMALFTAAFIIF